jgi:hypothetical protein
MKKTGLGLVILVIVLNCPITAASNLSDLPSVLPNLALFKKLGTCRALDAPIIFSFYNPREDGEDRSPEQLILIDLSPRNVMFMKYERRTLGGHWLKSRFVFEGSAGATWRFVDGVEFRSLKAKYGIVADYFGTQSNRLSCSYVFSENDLIVFLPRPPFGAALINRVCTLYFLYG